MSTYKQVRPSNGLYTRQSSLVLISKNLTFSINHGCQDKEHVRKKFPPQSALANPPPTGPPIVHLCSSSRACDAKIEKQGYAVLEKVFWSTKTGPIVHFGVEPENRPVAVTGDASHIITECDRQAISGTLTTAVRQDHTQQTEVQLLFYIHTQDVHPLVLLHSCMSSLTYLSRLLCSSKSKGAWPAASFMVVAARRMLLSRCVGVNSNSSTVTTRRNNKERSDSRARVPTSSGVVCSPAGRHSTHVQQHVGPN